MCFFFSLYGSHEARGLEAMKRMIPSVTMDPISMDEGIGRSTFCDFVSLPSCLTVYDTLIPSHVLLMIPMHNQYEAHPSQWFIVTDSILV